MEKDFSECHDLADKSPDKRRELVEMWWAETGKYNVLPLDDRTHARLLARETSENILHILSRDSKGSTGQWSTYKEPFVQHSG